MYWPKIYFFIYDFLLDVKVDYFMNIPLLGLFTNIFEVF